MSIASDLIRGHTDTIILARLMGGDNYGYEINKAIMQITGNRFELKEATLYTAFRRLEASGCIVSYWGDEQTGARRNPYEPGRKGLFNNHRIHRGQNSANTRIRTPRRH